MSADMMTLIAAAAVIVVAFWIPAYLSRRIKHGEARFDSETGKLKDDE